MLLLAAVVWNRPARAPAVDLTRLEAQFDARLKHAVAESETRQQRRTADLLAAAEERHERERRELLLTVDENLRVMRMRFGSLYLASNGGAPR
jgi:hypothetical protein